MSKKRKPKKEEPNTGRPQAQAAAMKQQEIKSVDWASLALPSFLGNKALHIVLVFLLSTLFYSNTIGHRYAVDDSIVIVRNSYTKKGLKGMAGIWGEDTFVGFFGKREQLVEGGRYRPFSVATFALENELFGEIVVDAEGKPILDEDGDINYLGNPHISHAINILLYGLLCVLVYLLILKLLQTAKRPEAEAYGIALVAALVYALHPIHTEAVANIKGRDEILVGMGSLLALYCTVRAVEEQGAKRMAYILAGALAFGMGIFSKENAITFLAIIPVCLYLFQKKSIASALKYTAPYLVISALFWFVVRRSVLGPSPDSIPTELMNNPFLKYENGTYIAFTVLEKLQTCLYSWLYYLKLLFLPHPLTNDYYPKHIHLIEPSRQILVFLSFAVHAALVVFTLRGLLQRKTWAWALVFYAATFSVVSNLFFPIGTVMAERFLFLPSLGFAYFVALGFWNWIEKRTLKQGDFGKAAFLPGLLLAVMLLGYGIKTFERNYAWKDDYTLFTNDIAYSPNSAKLNNAVSGVLQDSALRISDRNTREDYYRRAREHALKAIELHPTYNQAHLLLGNSCVFQGDLFTQKAKENSGDKQGFEAALAFYDEAIKAYLKVQQLRPDHPDVGRNLGVVYRSRGKLLGEYMGRLPQAIQSLEQSYSYNNKDTETLRLLGVANGVAGLDEQALRYLQEAEQVNPENVAILYNLEIAYNQNARRLAEQGQNEQVQTYLQKAQEMRQRWQKINPDYNPAAGNQDVQGIE